MANCFAPSQIRAGRSACSVRAQLITPKAHSNIPRAHISAQQQRGSRQKMAWSADAGRVAPAPQAKEQKKPVKQTITVAVDGTEDSVEGVKWVLDNFADTGLLASSDIWRQCRNALVVHPSNHTNYQTPVSTEFEQTLIHLVHHLSSKVVSERISRHERCND